MHRLSHHSAVSTATRLLFFLQLAVLCLCFAILPARAAAQQAAPRYVAPTIDILPMIFETVEYDVLVEVVADGLFRPWGMVFLPNGDMLITERRGTVRLLRDGVLQEEPVAGSPEVMARQLSGLMDIALHPQIHSVGHRNQQGLAFHPVTGELWAHEHAPQGGDELNIIRPGANYGWPVVSFARDYGGARITERPWREGFEQPVAFWMPSIAPSGLMFYTGEKFPAWRNHAFVGAMRVGRFNGTGHLERIVLNENGEENAREWILEELGERIRDVRQGPDDLIYLLTESTDGVLLRLSPARGN